MNGLAVKMLCENSPDFSWDIVDFSAKDQPGVYCIYDELSGIAYIGRATNCRTRLLVHNSQLGRGVHCNKKLQSAHSEGGIFRQFVIEYCKTTPTTDLLEVHWIRLFKSCGRDLFNKNGAYSEPLSKYRKSEECVLMAKTLGYLSEVDSDTTRLVISTHKKAYIETDPRFRNIDIPLTHVETKTETMVTLAASIPTQYTKHQKEWAVSLYRNKVPSSKVEETTGVKANYVRVLSKRFVGGNAEEKEPETAVELSESIGIDLDIPVSEIVTPETIAEKQVETVAKHEKTPWRIVAFVVLTFAIVVGHAGLVWYDMSLLWSTPGKIGGGVVFAFILSGMVLMAEKSEQMAEVRENMLWAVGALEALAVVVHRGAFSRNAGEAYNAGFGVEYIWALSAVICLCSIGATIFYQKVIK